MVFFFFFFGLFAISWAIPAAYGGSQARGRIGAALLWLRCRLTAAALMGPPAWEPPRAAGVAVKRTKTGVLSWLRG